MKDEVTKCEAKLYAYRKTKEGVIVSFVIHPNDIPDELSLAPIGTHLVLGMKEVNEGS